MRGALRGVVPCGSSSPTPGLLTMSSRHSGIRLSSVPYECGSVLRLPSPQGKTRHARGVLRPCLGALKGNKVPLE